MEKTILKFLIASRVLLILLIVLPVFAIAFIPHAPAHAPRIKDKYGNSLNWAGYAVTGSTGSVTDVKGSWVVPAVNCSSTPNSYSSFWAGIDGYSSSTVEQTGTDSDCNVNSPNYYAWYEFYPKGSFIIPMAVHPGDVISAEVKYIGNGRFTATISDLSTVPVQSFSTSAKVAQAQRSSAEWIAEAPSSGGILPLANFSTAYFGYDTTGIVSTNNATVSGISGNIGSFGYQPITMVSYAGPFKARPSSLSVDGTSFSVQWISEGP